MNIKWHSDWTSFKLLLSGGKALHRRPHAARLVDIASFIPDLTAFHATQSVGVFNPLKTDFTQEN